MTIAQMQSAFSSDLTPIALLRTSSIRLYSLSLQLQEVWVCKAGWTQKSISSYCSPVGCLSNDLLNTVKLQATVPEQTKKPNKANPPKNPPQTSCRASVSHIASHYTYFFNAAEGLNFKGWVSHYHIPAQERQIEQKFNGGRCFSILEEKLPM